MTDAVGDPVFTPAVKRAQERKGSREADRIAARGGWRRTVTDTLARFIADRDSLYLGTSSAGGQPYVQHRGGRPGFLKVLDEHTLAFADFRGNRQYITTGNLAENDRAFIFLVDYPKRRRIKIWGRARVIDDDPALLERLADGSEGAPEQVVVFDVTAWDVNCPQHITPRFTEAEVEQRVAPLRRRITELEAALARRRGPGAPADDRSPTTRRRRPTAHANHGGA